MNKIMLFFASVGISFFSTLAFAESTSVETEHGLNMSGIDAILHASMIVKVVILILISLSILCWAIGWSKRRQLKTVHQANDHFDQLFWKTTSLDEVYEKLDAFQNSSHARVFKAAYSEMKKIADSPLMNKNQGSDTDSPQLSGLDNLERSLRKATENEMSELESRLTILATTGSTGPFIGLFGTVWGIMNSFSQIAQTGSANLAAVAPGISEALITTAIGLAAAIPAVIIYNHFITVIRKEEIYLNNFSADFLNIVKRNFFKG
jgi:biopolymer transport protein TolQ